MQNEKVLKNCAIGLGSQDGSKETVYESDGSPRSISRKRNAVEVEVKALPDDELQVKVRQSFDRKKYKLNKDSYSSFEQTKASIREELERRREQRALVA